MAISARNWFAIVGVSLAAICASSMATHAAAGPVSLTSPGGGSTVSGTVSFTAQVNSSDVGWINFNLDGFHLASSPPYSIDWNTTNSLNGTHYLEVLAYDSNGNLLGTDWATVMVKNAAAAPTPTPAGYFGNLPPHATLPSGSTCASKVLSTSSREGVSANTSYNQTTPSSSELSTFHQQPLWNNEMPASDFSRVDGNFTGTTDQIIRWAACKWGVDENALRAESWEETFWRQASAGDKRTDQAQCQTPNWNGWNGSYCYQSWGMFQLKVFDFNIWSEVHDSTAFNADFRAAYLRGCMNGDVGYLSGLSPEPGYPSYPSSDTNYMFWGCMGEWASGQWFDVGAIEYVTDVQQYILKAPWPKASSASAVKITSPASGNSVSGTITIATQLSSSAAWENVYIDGAYLNSSPPSSFDWNTSQVSAGSHTISAKAFNSSGSQIGTDSVSVNVGAGAVAITSPSSGSTVSGTVNIVTTIGSTVSWENIYLDGNYFASSMPMTFGWDSARVANGQHTILARGFNNQGQQVGSASITVNVSNGAVAITAPSNGATVSGGITIATQVSNSAAWDNVYVDGQYLGSSPPYGSAWQTTSVANGSHTILARAYNSGGAEIGSSSISVKVANGATVISSPVNGATVAGNVTIVTETNSSAAWENVYVDGQYLGSSPPYNFGLDTTSVANGSHTISTRAYNNSGSQIGSASVSVNVAN